jgi:2-polyprenyl-3-methyl-5-hydroxy-6-metoxy-1,4-benzoquinol methylase
VSERSYAELLAEEAERWGRAAREQARAVAPEWTAHRALRANALVHAPHVDALLGLVRPGMRILELGCGVGWLSLAMARRGAAVEGIDIAADALAIARSHYDAVKHEVRGQVTYRRADLNSTDLPAAAWDAVVARGIFHHLPDPERLVAEVHRALVPGGLLWVEDSHGTEALPVVLVAGFLMLVLPTEPSYAEKIRGLLRFRARIPERVRMSMEGHGFSPFEGVGRGPDWPGAITARFIVTDRVDHPALTGYLASGLRLPDRLALPLLQAIRVVDAALVRRGLWRGTGLMIQACKPAVSAGVP